MKEFVPSHRQLEIFKEWKESDHNLVIDAVAGCGKTTTLLKILELSSEKTLFLSFNKSIKLEIEEKIKDIQKTKNCNAYTSTLHSLGYSAIKESYRNVKFNNLKYYKLLKILKEKNEHIYNRYTFREVFKIKKTLIHLNEISRLFIVNDLKKIEEYATVLNRDLFKIVELETLWNSFLKIRKDHYNTNYIEIDFTDMIYLPVLKKLHIPHNPKYLMIDEAQDLNLCQHKLVQNLIKQGSIKKWIASGDPRQSIYAFAGAFTKSFDIFLTRENTKKLDLDICYRCPVDVINSANEVYNVIKPFKEESGIVQTVRDVGLIKENSMVLCRISTPLVSLFFELLKIGKSSYIKGNDILNDIVNSLDKHKNRSISETLPRMQKDYYEEDRYSPKRESIQNAILVVKNLSVLDDIKTINDIIKKIKVIFKPKKDSIILSTIHKVKGLESNVVYILNENLTIPHEYATTKEQIEQEYNLKYVARTRAKSEMYFLELNI